MFQEMIRLITSYPEGKSAGPDSIFMEQIKFGGDALWKVMGVLFSNCNRLATIPSRWKISHWGPSGRSGDAGTIRSVKDGSPQS